MNKKAYRPLIELLLTTGIMSLIMSGTILSYHHRGVSSEMIQIWIRTYPIAWAIAIPAILTARRLVGFILDSIFK